MKIMTLVRPPYRFLIVLSILVASSFCSLGKQTHAAPLLQEARVTRVHDGDTVTILMKHRYYKARLVGIDAPEMGQHPWGKQAKDRLSAILKRSNRTVFVETDEVKKDKYGRLLVYLWTKQTQLVNEVMVRDGYAVLYIIEPNVRYADMLRPAEQHARDEKKGIWGPRGLKESPAAYRKKHPRTD
jgi:micrococcal nuclease